MGIRAWQAVSAVKAELRVGVPPAGVEHWVLCEKTLRIKGYFDSRQSPSFKLMYTDHIIWAYSILL